MTYEAGGSDAALLEAPALAGPINIASWNVKRLGEAEQQSYPAMASIASKFDLIALQEVMEPSALKKLEGALEKDTGEKWGSIASHAIGSRKYSELYGFIYRESAVQYDQGAVVFLDRKNEFFREPYSAQFKTRDGMTFVLANIHVLYGKGVQDRTPEIESLADYWLWLEQVYPGQERILVGDFNLNPSHQAWASLKRHAKPLITKGATTLSAVNGRYASLYDNLWVARDTKLPIKAYGIVQYPRLLGYSHEKARKHVSDHAPVFLQLAPESAARDSDSTLPALEAPPQKVVNPVPNVGTAKPAAAPERSVRGNRNSMIYHLPSCPSYGKIAAKNQVEFETATKAQSAGYRLAGNCQ
jgi:endonuclease/exonuclease/phosphatase family metal-dependent hydrolase